MNEEQVRSHREVVVRTLHLIPSDKWPNIEDLVQYRIKRYGESVAIPEWNGYRLSIGFEQETAQYAYNKFEPNFGDVLVASYPKTGKFYEIEYALRFSFGNTCFSFGNQFTQI